MFFAVISIMPEMFTALSNFGITARAIHNKQAVLEYINPRDFTQDNYRRIDERPYGGGAGMVLMAEPLAKAIMYAKSLASEYGCQVDAHNCPVVYMSPQGQTLDESLVRSFAPLDGMIVLCGRYDGVDERLLERYVDKQISIGDYVLSGGELPAMVLMDSLIRRLPNVMGDELSAQQDSFVDGLLDYPQYTKPLDFEGLTVPAVLLSGHHANIAKWRFVQQVKRTQQLRADLWEQFVPNAQQKNWLVDN